MSQEGGRGARGKHVYPKIVRERRKAELPSAATLKTLAT